VIEGWAPAAAGASQKSGAHRPRGEEGEEVTCAASSLYRSNSCVEIWWTACGGLGVPRVRFAVGRVQTGGGTIAVRTVPREDLPPDGANREGAGSGTCGVGHTRWATHGRPSDETRTDLAGHVAVIHNGIVEATGRSSRR